MKTETMPLNELVKEHKRLVKVLRTRKGINQELRKQEKELKHYISKTKYHKSNSIDDLFPGWTHRSL